MKNYELIAKLSEFPAGAEVMCSGIETLDSVTNEQSVGEDDMGNKEYPITRTLADVDLEDKMIYLQW